MRREFEAALLALEFLSVIRLRRSPGAPERGAAGRSLRWFPAVGLLIGGLLALAAWGASALWPPPVTVTLLLAVNAALTGGLHLDGLADCADGIFGGHSPEQRLAIMRDSRVGTFGVLALLLVLLMQFAALVSLPRPALYAALLAAPVLGRLAMPLCIRSFPYARPAGLGAWYKEAAGATLVVSAAAIAAVLLIAVTGLNALLLAPSLAAALAAGSLATRRLGGATGDVYGACGVLVETAVILIIAAAPEHGWLAPWLAG